MGSPEFCEHAPRAFPGIQTCSGCGQGFAIAFPGHAKGIQTFLWGLQHYAKAIPSIPGHSDIYHS
eukprot:10544130-Lingulodinium_polyedra.AAC.1